MPESASRWALPLIGLASLEIASLAYCYDRHTYFAVLKVLIANPYRSPFIDAQQVPAVIDCWRRGLDVYVTAPCDPMQRRWAYSPLWLLASFIPAWRNWMGLALGTAFFVSLALLPRPRRRDGKIVMIMATVSSMPVFAVERGNMDLVIFILIAMGGWFWYRNFWLRLIAYAFFACAGFLKFYPLVLFALFIRERFNTFLVLCGLALALIAAFVMVYHGLLREAGLNLPVYAYNADAFGATQLPDGLLTWLQKTASRGPGPYGFLVSMPFQAGFIFGSWVILLAVSIALGLRLAVTPYIIAAVAGLAPDELGFLVIGAALLCGCFFAGMSDSYRGIHFLFVLPGLLALANSSAGRVFGITVAAILFIMWGLTAQFLLAMLLVLAGRPVHDWLGDDTYWLIHELAWWWVISVLLAILFCFITQSPAWQDVTRAIRRREPAKT